MLLLAYVATFAGKIEEWPVMSYFFVIAARFDFVLLPLGFLVYIVRLGGLVTFPAPLMPPAPSFYFVNELPVNSLCTCCCRDRFWFPPGRPAPGAYDYGKYCELW